MALVHIDLAELDGYREALKEAKEAKAILTSEIEKLKKEFEEEKHKYESGAVVIERIPQYQVVHGIDPNSRTITTLFFDIIRECRVLISSSQASYIENRVKDFTNMYSSFSSGIAGNSTYTGEIKTIKGYPLVAEEVKEYYQRENKELIDSYKQYVANVEKYKKEIKDNYDNKLKIENEKLTSQFYSMENECNQKIQKAKKDCDDVVKNLKLQHEKELEQYIQKEPEETELYKVLEKLGYEIKPASFFSSEFKVKKIKK